MNEEDGKIKVSIQCITYNQESYIRQCLDGFVMQKTSFPFVAIVHDDASTDCTAEIVKEYAQKYPSIIIPIFEKENQYSKKDGSLSRIMEAATHGEYVAICEGDDYWTDPYKLQKQVDYMDAHPEYSMCYHDALFLHPDGTLHKRDKLFCENRDVSAKDIFLHWAEVMTNSILYRNNMIDYPEFREWKEGCTVGDGPLEMWLSMKGRVYYMDEVMSVYRVASIGSYSSRINKSGNQAVQNTMKNYQWFNKILDKVPEDYKQYVQLMIQCQIIRLNILTGDYKSYSIEGGVKDGLRFLPLKTKIHWLIGCIQSKLNFR